MIKRKLASIQMIKNLEPIKNADKIELATILGWKVVVKKNDFSIGDLCVYFEIDSLLPETEWSKFLENKKYRIKTLRFRGCLSQGLVMPISIDKRLENLEIGADVTDLLSIEKYDKPIPQTQEIKGNFISCVPKTDEFRIQSFPELINKIDEKDFYATVKLDGTSSTFANINNEFIACGRNWQIKEGNNKYWRIVNKYNLKEKLLENECIQGEICGPGIEKNKLGLTDEKLFIFNYFKINFGYLNYFDLLEFCYKNNLNPVPLDFIVIKKKNNYIDKIITIYKKITGNDIKIINRKDFINTIDSWLEIAKGNYDNGHIREGLVVRPIKNTNGVNLPQISFKVINNDFLLK